MHTCVGRYCDSGNDERAAHFNWPTLPRWWGSLRDMGQSLITLAVRVSQPHLHKPDANQMHLTLIFTRHHISSLPELRHATLCKLSWLWKPNTHSLNSFAWLKEEPVCICDLMSMKLALACNLLYLQIQLSDSLVLQRVQQLPTTAKMPIPLPQLLFWCLNKHHVTDKRSLWCTRTMFFPSGSSGSSHLPGIVAAWALTDTVALWTKTEQQKKRKFRKMCHISIRHFYMFLCIIINKISGQCGRWGDLGWSSLTDLITDEKTDGSMEKWLGCLGVYVDK